VIMYLLIKLGWLSLMSTLEESLVANSGSTKVWVMDSSLFDVKWYIFLYILR
jgi:hypothetical protein